MVFNRIMLKEYLLDLYLLIYFKKLLFIFWIRYYKIHNSWIIEYEEVLL